MTPSPQVSANANAPAPKASWRFRWPWRAKGFVRRFSRHECCVVAKLRFIERDIELEGVILEISAGGVLFREASTHILDRSGEAVEVLCETWTWRGVVVNVKPVGYGVKLSQLIPDPIIEQVVATWGIHGPAAAKSA